MYRKFTDAPLLQNQMIRQWQHSTPHISKLKNNYIIMIIWNSGVDINILIFPNYLFFLAIFFFTLNFTFMVYGYLIMHFPWMCFMKLFCQLQTLNPFQMPIQINFNDQLVKLMNVVEVQTNLVTIYEISFLTMTGHKSCNINSECKIVNHQELYICRYTEKKSLWNRTHSGCQLRWNAVARPYGKIFPASALKTTFIKMDM